MSTIGTVGSVGSGLDVESIVKALVDADVAPKNNSLNRRESDLTAEFSAIGQLKSALSGLDTALTGLQDGTTFDLMTTRWATDKPLWGVKNAGNSSVP